MVVWKLYPSFVGGTERQTRILAQALAALGARVDVICARVPSGDDPAKLPFRIVPVGWTEGVPTLVAEFVFSRRAADVIARGRYDVVYGPNLALWQFVRRKHVPCVMNPYGLEPLNKQGWLAAIRGYPRRRAWRYTARRADLVVTAGGKLTAQLEQMLGVDPARVVEIPIGVDLEEIDAMRRSLGAVPKLPGAFLCVARLEFNKGVDILIEAFRMLDAQGPAHLYVIGDGTLRHTLKRDVPPNVTLLGYQPDEALMRWYQRVEALILPSRFEALGAVILEAMASALPVIATDIGAVSTVVDRETGWLVEPGNPHALAQVIKTCLSLSPGTRTLMGTRARERVAARFGWDTVGRRVLAVLTELAGTGRAGPGAG